MKRLIKRILNFQSKLMNSNTNTILGSNMESVKSRQPEMSRIL